MNQAYEKKRGKKTDCHLNAILVVINENKFSTAVK
jgi:hypothetical protein